MIIDALFAIMSFILDVIISVRPDWQPQLPEGIVDAILYIRELDAMLPATELMICGSLTLSAFGALYVWKWILKLADWIADVIP